MAGSWSETAGEYPDMKSSAAVLESSAVRKTYVRKV